MQTYAEAAIVEMIQVASMCHKARQRVEGSGLNEAD